MELNAATEVSSLKGSYDRYRRTDNRHFAMLDVEDFDIAGNSQGIRGPRTEGAIGHDKYIYDRYDSSYYERINNGEVIVRPMTARTLHSHSQSMSASTGYIPGWGTRTWKGDAAFHVRHDFQPEIAALLAREQAGLEDWAMTSALAKVESPEVLLAVATAELEKTRQMMKSPLKPAFELIGRMKLRRAELVLKGLDFARASSMAWLEYVFGWRNVVIDTFGMATAIAKTSYATPHPTRKVVKGGVTRKFETTRDDTPSGSALYVTNVQATNALSLGVKVGAGVIYDVYWNPAIGALRDFGLGLDHIGTTVWELVPLSWFADYFANTGKWIASYVPRAGVVYRGTWITTKLEVDTTTSASATIDVYAEGKHTVIPLNLGGWNEKYSLVTRRIGTTRPHWSLRPGEFTGSQAVNAVTLGFAKLGQQLKDFHLRR